MVMGSGAERASRVASPTAPHGGSGEGGGGAAGGARSPTQSHAGWDVSGHAGGRLGALGGLY